MEQPIVDPSTTGPFAARRGDDAAARQPLLEGVFDDSRLEPADLVHDDVVARRWDAERGAWVVDPGLDVANTYAAEDPPPPPAWFGPDEPVLDLPEAGPRARRDLDRRVLAGALSAAVFGGVVFAVLFG